MTAPHPGQLDGVRILVIDDLEDSADALGQLLQLEGADAVTETSARKAIERAQREKFDVIISDIAMPGMDGYSMLRAIRAHPLNAATPAIAHSGYGGREDTDRSKVAGFQLHVTKPVGVDELLAAIVSARGMTQ